MLHSEAVRARARDIGISLQRLNPFEHIVGFGLIEEVLHSLVAVCISTQYSRVELLDEVIGTCHGLPFGHHHAALVDSGAFGPQREVLVLDCFEERLVVLGQSAVKEPLYNTLHVVTLTLGSREVCQQHVDG